MNDEEGLRKSQRSTRGHGQSTVDYDMKHHPMDDFLRPKCSAKRQKNTEEVSEQSSDSVGEVDKDNDSTGLSKKVSSSYVYRRRSSRNVHSTERPIYSAKWHPLDQMLKDNASAIGIRKEGDHSKDTRKFGGSSFIPNDEVGSIIVVSTQDVDEASETDGKITPISPSQRRSTRIWSSKAGPPNYDMKYCDLSHNRSTSRLTSFSRYHVMDSTLRPKATAKRMKSRLQSKTLSKAFIRSTSSNRSHTRQPAKSLPKSLTRRPAHQESKLERVGVSDVPARPHLHNPYLNRVSLDWTEIEEMDRRVYLVQKGVPLDTNILAPHWTPEAIKEVFSNEDVNTLDELSSRDTFEIMKNRYESVRFGLQNFFRSEPEPAQNTCWTLTKTEGLDVYDKNPGSRYWRHQKDSVVKEMTSTSFNIMGSSFETADHVMRTQMREATANLLEICSKSPPALKVNSERKTNFDREDESERGAITETEDTLIESMRGEHVTSSIMSDAALEELLLPAEQHLGKEEPDHEVTTGSISSDSRGCERAGKGFANPDRTLDKRGLAEAVQKNKDEIAWDDLVGHHGKCDEPQTAWTQMKTRKGKSRADIGVTVHEDLPGRTPIIKRIIRMNPASPGTDIPKENLEVDGSVEGLSQADVRMPQTRRHHRAIGSASFRRVHVATNVTPPYRSFSSSPASSRTIRETA